MTKLQFVALLSPAIGSFVLVILAWMFTNTRIGRVEAAVYKLGAEMSQLRRDLHAELSTFRDSIHRDMVGLHERVAVAESKQ